MHEEPEIPWRMPCFVLSIVCSALAALLTVSHVALLEFRQQAIERGYAEYNQKTGLWQWKEKAR